MAFLTWVTSQEAETIVQGSNGNVVNVAGREVGYFVAVVFLIVAGASICLYMETVNDFGSRVEEMMARLFAALPPHSAARLT
jgi:hypothetical protein